MLKQIMTVSDSVVTILLNDPLTLRIIPDTSLITKIYSMRSSMWPKHSQIQWQPLIRALSTRTSWVPSSTSPCRTAMSRSSLRWRSIRGTPPGARAIRCRTGVVGSSVANTDCIATSRHRYQSQGHYDVLFRVGGGEAIAIRLEAIALWGRPSPV